MCGVVTGAGQVDGAKIAVRVKSVPDAVQAPVIGVTLRTADEPANRVSQVAFERGVPREYEPRKAPLNENPSGFIGVDLGIVDIATTSTGYRAAGRGLNRHRKRRLELCRKLQAKGTKSAERLLKRRSRREQRHAANVNHIIAKQIATTAERTGRGIALEDLTGIRDRVRLRKDQRAPPHSWGFHRLGRFIAHKALRTGVPLVYADPAYTSRTCSECGHIDRKNRVDQATFACRACGFLADADDNASHDIDRKGEAVWTAGRESRVPATP